MIYFYIWAVVAAGYLSFIVYDSNRVRLDPSPWAIVGAATWMFTLLFALIELGFKVYKDQKAPRED